MSNTEDIKEINRILDRLKKLSFLLYNSKNTSMKVNDLKLEEEIKGIKKIIRRKNNNG